MSFAPDVVLLPRFIPAAVVNREPGVTITRVKDALLTAGEQLDFVQDVLSLSVTQIASILKVARPTIYAWMREEVGWPRDPEVARRLMDLAGVARRWRELSDRDLGRFIDVPVDDAQRSLVDLLVAPDLADVDLDETLRLLADRLNRRTAERVGDSLSNSGQPASDAIQSVETDKQRLRLRALARRARSLGGQ
jgi:hypothetical protein